MGQEVLGLLLASLFATTLNMAIVARWVWFEAFGPGWADFLFAFAALAWSASFAYTIWWVWLCHPDRHRREIDRLYHEAMEAYLQGRWDDARKRIERVLAMDDADADALLQLGTILARTRQYGPAKRAFRQCLDQDGGDKWRWEVETALARLDRV
jgi:tetratricopeptide (TPR) repeat protein